MEAVSKAFFRRLNPRYSFAPAGSEHGRQSVARLQILRLPRGNQEDYAFGDFEYTVRTIVGIRFQKFRFYASTSIDFTASLYSSSEYIVRIFSLVNPSEIIF